MTNKYTEQRLMQYLSDHPESITSEIAAELGVVIATIGIWCKKLREADKIHVVDWVIVNYQWNPKYSIGPLDKESKVPQTRKERINMFGQKQKKYRTKIETCSREATITSGVWAGL